ncbi:DNA translocase SftA [Mammaliicoccus sciuri]|uniref:FtsK/SpoIIIE domain-containing protein n=1 Tax=Mammaliicoccus sciuri TaxID=1296 RepID=UPI001EF6DC78|nr:FtsK/SpoIIIE domain-containing protein [Mammaliicoccus sciuri]CAG7915009.1 DNA translocase SftA [Mammaliicoccus sciuri]
MTKQKGLVIFSQMTLRILKLIFWIWLVGLVLLNIFKFLYVKIVHFMFDGNFLLNSYDFPFNPLNAVLKKEWIPNTSDWGTRSERFLNQLSHNLMIYPLWILGGLLLIYIVLNVLRSHYGEMTPFKSDFESLRLKKDIIRHTDSRLRDKSTRSGKHGDTYNVFKWVFNREVRRERNSRKADRIVKRAIRRSKVSISATVQKGHVAGIKRYYIIIKKPKNMEASSKLESKLKNFHEQLMQFTGVTFDQIKTSQDRKNLLFEGSVEKEIKEARSVKKKREQLAAMDKTTDYETEDKNTNGQVGNYPLELLIDRSKDIEEDKKAAEAYALEKQDELEKFFAAEKMQVDLESRSTGTTSISYKYKAKYSQNHKSKTQLQEGLRTWLTLQEVIVDDYGGKITVNIPLPSDSRVQIDNRKLIKDTLSSSTKPLQTIFGVDLDNQTVTHNLRDAPHMLVSGSTGSGKSVAVNYILLSILWKASPKDVQIALIDPKAVEFGVYEDNPFNMVNPIDNAKDSVTFLKYLCILMDERYQQMKKAKTREIEGYNKKMAKKGKETMSTIVCVIDEYADLVMVQKDVEKEVSRLAQKGRACGIHLIVATQRPSADIVTGIVRSNIMTRLTFQVVTSTDSRIALGEGGYAEALNGAGDGLLKWKGQTPVTRLQGGFLIDDEVENINNHLKDTIEQPIHVNYKEVVARHEGDEEALAQIDELQEATTSLVETQQSFEKESKQKKEKVNRRKRPDEMSKEDVALHQKALDIMKEKSNKKNTKQSAGSVKNKVVSVNVMDYFEDEGTESVKSQTDSKQSSEDTQSVRDLLGL